MITDYSVSPRPGFGTESIFYFCALAIVTTVLTIGSGAVAGQPKQQSAVIVAKSYHHDVSPPLRDILSPAPASDRADKEVPAILPPILTFPGLSGVDTGVGRSDQTGEAGASQYLQVAGGSYEVFDKATGTSLLGPAPIESIWTGFGGVCQNDGGESPRMLYDQLANRWVVTQFAGSGPSFNICVAVSTSNDATGSWNRYGFSVSSDLLTSPQLAMWPDAYYMSTVDFNSDGTDYLGPQPFAFDRAAMLAGNPTAAMISFPPLGSSFPPMLPADLDGLTPPPGHGQANPFIVWPDNNVYRTYRFHVDFVTPSNSTFTLFDSPPASSFTLLCPGNVPCIPQLGTNTKLEANADRMMPRLSYRNFGDHDSLIGNWTVDSNGVAAIRWFELRGVTNGPEIVYQESTYRPDRTWRWVGSVAMDGLGNMALGFNASGESIFPQIRYAGRLVSDPLNTLAQGEAHLFDGTGAQTSSSWTGFSDMTVDPVDDETFWYTQEYYDGAIGNWRTRIGSFKVPSNNLVSAASRLTHGSDAFDIPMPLVGESGVEDRSALTYNAVFTFDAPVKSGEVTVEEGTATVGAIIFDGNTMTAHLTGVTDAQIVTFRVQNINGDGWQHGDVAFGFLIGDVNGDRKVGQADRKRWTEERHNPVTGRNFRVDINTNGFFDSDDLDAIRMNRGHVIP